ncbi:short-chain dehydrogenase/reductase [Bordetella genomosp. 8]|uniref:Short-chain dehydrogenase/reductase n=1 Tax=Bordetella genomosp. 8 TaxID=1416806 RepID=A0A1W6YH02_9BORD|nr:oxidoreductase [Bordetella genomosp. 8]ARP80395.1 short-chain dehydrogenase/reductase [Bordetella genomosp. 8]
MTTTTSSSFKRVWFITGAARGLGALIADAALADGNAVVVAGRNLAALAKRFGDAPNVLAVQLDVTDETQARAAASAAIGRFGRIDVLINNAGFGLLGAVEEADDADVRRMYDTNVFGLLNVTRAILPHMRERKAGHVINISSIGGYRSAAGFGVYCSTKFAVEGLTEALHDELAPLGIHATVVEPGYFRTDFLDATSLVKSPTIIADYAETAGQVRERAVQINHQQPGDPKRLAAAMIKLVDADQPPLRMPFGTDTLAAIADKNAYVAEETAAWSELAASTDFPR